MLASAIAIAFAAVAATAPSIPLRLTVQLIRRCPPAAPCVPSTVVRDMTREAERIWLPLGVELDWTELRPGKAVSRSAPDLVLLVEEHPNPVIEGADRRNLVLGRMHRPDTMCDAGLARLWVTHVRRQIDAVYINGLPLLSVPTRMEHVLLARALGRTLAHEIGHYLLGPDHAAQGLMRAQFTPRELIETLGRYGLDDANRRTLTARLSDRRSRECGIANGSVGPISQP
jgi:hypothetical protein